MPPDQPGFDSRSKSLQTRIVSLGPVGSAVTVTVGYTIGSPEGQEIAREGSLRLQIDAPVLWQKQSGGFSAFGWAPMLGTPGPPGPPGETLWVSVDDYGASRNPLVDSTAAFQAAVNDASAGTAGTAWVLVPYVDIVGGEAYGIYSTVTIPPNVVLFGVDGADGNASLVRSFVALGDVVFQFAAGINRSGISGLQILAPAGAPAGIAVSFTGSQFNYAKNLQIWDHEIGIDLSDGVIPFSAYNVVEQCEINRSTVFGIRSALNSNGNTILGGRVFFTHGGGVAAALSVVSSRALSVQGLALEDYDFGLQLGGSSSASFTGMYMEKGVGGGPDFQVLPGFAESPFFEGGISFDGNHHADPYPLANGFIDAATYGVLPNGLDHAAELQHALDDAAANNIRMVLLPAGTIVIAAPVLYPGEVTLTGQGSQATVLSFTGVGTCLSQATPGVRIFNCRFIGFQITIGAGDVGLHLNDVTFAHVTDVIIIGPGIGVGNGTSFRVSSSTNGFSLYNRFDHCRASSCEIGFDVAATGSNEQHIIDCRTAACTRGVRVVNSNHVVVLAGAFESGTDGVAIESTVANIADNLTIQACRFEGNTNANIIVDGVAANVRGLNVKGNAHVTGTAYTNVDGTAQMNISGDTITAQGRELIETAMAAADGTPFTRRRTTAGSAAAPMQVLEDTNEGSGTPTTLEIRSGRVLGHAIGIGRITAGVYAENFYVEAGGRVVTVSDVAVTGNIELITSVTSQILIGDGVTSGNPQIVVRKGDANNLTWLEFRVGTPTTGRRWSEQFNSNEDRVGLVFDAAGTLLTITPYRFRYSAVNGRSGMAFNRIWADQGTTLVNGDWALSAGWGTTATAVVSANAKGQRGEVTFTSAGVGQAANPTATLTFPEGTWTTAPEPMVIRNGGTGVGITGFTFACTATTLVITAVGTPIATETYVVRWMLMG